MGEPSKIRFAVVGSGWRAGFYLRAAKELPSRFEAVGLVTRSAEKGARIEAEWGVKTYRSLDALLAAAQPEFAVVSVAGFAAPQVTREAAAHGLPVLAETPPAPDLAGLIGLSELERAGARIQVAEQYHLQPMHAARIALARSGRLGAIRQAQASFSHGYHAMSILRRLLSVGFENASIRAVSFGDRFVAGPARTGLPEQETMKDSTETIATLDFGGKIAVYDFAADQHRSYVRSQRILVKGERGEIDGGDVLYLTDHRHPAHGRLELRNAGLYGNLEGYSVQGVTLGGEWLYETPFPGARLSEDELAVAHCLLKMHEYLYGGPEFYSLAEAAQDHYLGMMVEEAARTGETVVTQTQPWAGC